MRGSSGVFSGEGHKNFLNSIDSIFFHSISAGSPESPGFFQYICQPGSISNLMPMTKSLLTTISLVSTSNSIFA